MPEHPNTTMARGFVDAFTRGDLATVGAAFAQDAVWDLPGRGTLAGEYRGRTRSSASWRRRTSCPARR